MRRLHFALLASTAGAEMPETPCDLSRILNKNPHFIVDVSQVRNARMSSRPLFSFVNKHLNFFNITGRAQIIIIK